MGTHNDRARGALLDDTWRQYNNVERLRDAGKHLLFMSGNNAYWNVRIADGGVTGRAGHIVHRVTAATALETSERSTLFRLIGRPENALYGVMYMRHGRRDELRPVVVADTSNQGSEARQFLRDAALSPGDIIPGAVLSEGDQIVENGKTPANLQVLFRSSFAQWPGQEPGVFHATFFVARSGAGVFASGTNEWARRLDSFFGQEESPHLQRLTKSVLDWMLSH